VRRDQGGRKGRAAHQAIQVGPPCACAVCVCVCVCGCVCGCGCSASIARLRGPTSGQRLVTRLHARARRDKASGALKGDALVSYLKVQCRCDADMQL
jgi:hypothetical protein